MAITREQADIIANRYNGRRITNKLKMEERIQEVYALIPEMADLDREVSGLALRATKNALAGDSSYKDSLKEDIAIISERKKALLLANHFPADYLDEIFTCPDCRDTGYVNQAPCHCLKDEIVKLLYSRSELQEILNRENFDSFDYSLYSDDYIDETTGISAAENIETVIDHCHYFINHFDKTFDNLLFYGRAGTGKTFLINCIAKELIEKSYSVIYLSAVQLFDLMADYSFRRDNHSVYSQISMDELIHCDLLIIDDLGTEMTNSFTDSSLFDCLNERLIHQKSTVISTNLSLQELQDRYEERIFSRAAGNYTPLKIFGDDIRIKKNYTL